MSFSTPIYSGEWQENRGRFLSVPQLPVKGPKRPPISSKSADRNVFVLNPKLLRMPGMFSEDLIRSPPLTRGVRSADVSDYVQQLIRNRREFGWEM